MPVSGTVQNQIERRDAAQLKERAGVVPPRGPRRRSGVVSYHMNRRISTEVHEHNLLNRSARPGAARSSEAGRARRCRGRRARRGGCRLVTLSPSFMPRLLTRMPPLLSDLVPCDTGRPCAAPPSAARHTALPAAVPERPSAAAGEPAVGFGRMRRRAPKRTRSSAVSLT